MAADFAAGCLGGCAGVIVGYPFDTVKVHIQTQNHLQPKYHGTFHCLRTLIVQNGATSLYRGMSSPLASVAAINALIFGVYGNVQRNLPNPNALSSHLFAGGVAGLVQSPICSVSELIKTRMQLLNKNTKQGAVECLRRIYQNEGVRGVFRGNLLTLFREVPSFSTYFVTYEVLTRSSNPGAEISTPMMLLAGGLAGTMSWVVTYPIDVLKSRIQADGVYYSKYSGAMDCLRYSVKTEGVRCLFRGLNSAIVRAFPTNAACFTVVTWSMKLMDGHYGKMERREVHSESSHLVHVAEPQCGLFMGKLKGLVGCTDVNPA